MDPRPSEETSEPEGGMRKEGKSLLGVSSPESQGGNQQLPEVGCGDQAGGARGAPGLVAPYSALFSQVPPTLQGIMNAFVSYF